MGQGMHDRPGDIGVTGSVGARGAVGDLATVGGPTLDGQERGGDVVPACVPFDTATLDRVLRLEHQGIFGFQAVMDRRRPGEEVAHQVEYAVPHPGNINPNVLNVETRLPTAGYVTTFGRAMRWTWKC